MAKTLPLSIAVALAVASGFMGSLLTRLITPAPALAQSQAPSTQVAQDIRAQSFTLVDSLGHTVGTFTTASRNRISPPRIVLRDAEGHVMWSPTMGIERLSEN